MSTISEQPTSERRRSLAGVAILALTIAAVAGVLVVVLVNAVL
jgi:hypothetical protein